MANSVGGAELWLPSSFLVDADQNCKTNTDMDASFGFPSEFPYEFGVPSPAVESVEGSTETESSDEEEDFFVGFTRRLSQSSLHETRKQLSSLPIKTDDVAFSEITTKSRGLAGSPQSTLSGIGSWSGRSGMSGDGSPNGYSRVPSPSTTPFGENNDPWEVIYAAAGEVARLKINNHALQFNIQDNRGVPGHPHTNQSFDQVQQQVRQKQQYGASVWGRQVKPNWFRNRGCEFGYESLKCSRPMPSPQSAWPSLQPNRVQHDGSGSRVAVPVPGGTSVKRGSGGTGVFLPRHYDSPSEPRNKTGCAPVLLPAKMVHALNLNINDLNASCQPRFSNAFVADYDALLARRNARLTHRRLSLRRDEAPNYEVRLPQEWTY
ncbi:hypothetical protein VNO77_43730 [Canavalia gladiata]|uniref:Uncharacterized protein n=1 Tax=Canavalia gladiata TaxID=3824 RepID=A0AAN9JWY4_CANGL